MNWNEVMGEVTHYLQRWSRRSVRGAPL